MQVVTSYKVKIAEYNSIFDGTLAIYREALAYLMAVVNDEWDSIKDVPRMEDKQKYIERLTHNTKMNIAKYDFDSRFHKYPSYLRRSTTVDAIGKVQSYKSNCAKWESEAKKGKPPTFQTCHDEYPALYKDNMYVRTDDYTAKIKIYHKNDWVWLGVNLRKSDADYILRHKSSSRQTIPTLEKKGRNWYLRFAFVDEVKLTDSKNMIIGVDLGINNAATCCAMLPDGTVIGRKVISCPVEKDQMEHKLNKIKKAQRNGAKRTPRLWAYANNYNRALSERTAGEIIAFAILYNANIIVFEHLDMQGKKRGSKKQRLHMWRKKAVIGMVSCKAHLLGMRISTVCAWGTSKYAYDGSGVVARDKDNYSVCAFQTGKRYHSDLNASYNIAARYYIRERLKPLPETARLEVSAKVPRLSKRTTCVLSDLISLNAVFAA